MRGVVLVLFIGLIGCNQGIHVPTSVEPEIPLIEDSLLYERDKKQIITCYAANVRFQSMPKNETRSRFSMMRVGNPESLEVLGIYYSSDLLRGVVFLSSHQISETDSILKYDVFPVFVLRDDIESGFSIYPSDYAIQVGFLDQQQAFKRIKLYWFHTLHEDKDLNLGGKFFWERNKYFKKVKLTDTGEEVYEFQTYTIPALGNKHYYDNHFLHCVLDCGGEIDTAKTNGSNCVDLEFVREKRQRMDLD